MHWATMGPASRAMQQICNVVSVALCIWKTQWRKVKQIHYNTPATCAMQQICRAFVAFVMHYNVLPLFCICDVFVMHYNMNHNTVKRQESTATFEMHCNATYCSKFVIQCSLL